MEKLEELLARILEFYNGVSELKEGTDKLRRETDGVD